MPKKGINMPNMGTKSKPSRASAQSMELADPLIPLLGDVHALA
jgi:hypothetical protein